jgi:type IX secretion system PorP/SprF family membrane protein
VGKFKWFFPLLAGLVYSLSLSAQDPSFSQFFSSPLNVNPALTGNINGQWRVISNLRSQWAGPAYPYNTGTISFDMKLLKNKLPENSILGIGGMMMYDKVMGGVLKSNYASLNGSYKLQIAEGYNGGTHQLGAGIGFIYGNRAIDFTRLSFGEQFNGYGFDRNLPNGEFALSEMKAYISSSAGIIYSFNSEFSSLDVGFAGFHLNKPKQTFLEDQNQILPVRYVAHANFEHFINNSLVLNTNAIYQKQSSTSYFSVGAAMGYYLSSDENILINGGLWYWSDNAVIPYVGFVYKNFQVGMTYDITISDLNDAARHPNTWEISLILRGDKGERNTGIIPCPWK